MLSVCALFCTFISTMKQLLFLLSISIPLCYKAAPKLPIVEYEGREMHLYSYEELKEVKDFNEVEAIDLTAENLISINGIAAYSNLRYLKLSGNKDLKGFSGLSRLKKLEVIFLIKCDLTEIPEEIAKCTSLKKLYFNGNSLKDISRVTSLVNLKELDFINCDLKEIPKGFSNLKNLKKNFKIR